MPLTIVPHVLREATVHALGPDASAQEAARLMAEHDISSVLVTQGDSLLGIVTERDLSRRVVATDRLASKLTVSQIMTARPQTITPTATPAQALAIMERLRVRHLPVVDNGRALGVVSIRDLQLSMSRHVLAI
jgi:CBS domain-containing protein